MKLRTIIVGLLVMIVALAGCSSSTPSSSSEDSNLNNNEQQESEEVSQGKELRIAYDTNPPTLDPHMSTAVATMEPARPIYEGLIALDSKYVAQPMLAESWEESPDRKSITFHLRKGVKFHNGKEMVAEDVVASMNRWKDLSIMGRGNFADATFKIEDDYTVVLHLAEPNSIALLALGNNIQFSAIMPKEVIESAGSSGVEEYIGTGPYKLKEWVPDQYLHLVKFDDYQALSTAKDGLAGKKEALVENIIIELVTDPTTRVSGVQTGQYDIVTTLSHDSYDLLEQDPEVSNYAFHYGFNSVVFNKKEGLFSNKKARQAVLAALNMEDILYASFGNEKFFNLENSIAIKDQVDWYSEAGKNLYNQKNVEKAKQLLQESGYNGEEITYIVTRTYEDHYNAGVTIQQQLEAIGMNIKLEVYDWSTLLERRQDSSVWDMFTTGFPTEAVPITYIFLNSKNEYPGWTENDTIDRLISDIKQATSQEEASELFDQLQEEFYDYVPMIPFGNHKTYHATRENIKGLDYFGGGLIFWGVDKQD